MRNWKLAGLAVVVLAVGLGARSVHKEPTGDCRARAEAFLKDVVAGDINGAYDRLLGLNLSKEEKDSVETLKIKTRTAVNVYGKALGTDFIREQRYGGSITRLVYVMKYDKSALIWELYFYKPQSEWRLANVKFNDDLNLLAEK